MKTQLLKFLVRPKTIFLLVTGIGLLFSGAIYYASLQMSSNAKQLLDKQLPTLFVTQQLTTLLSRQEKALYEYFTTSNSDNFYLAYLTNLDKFKVSLGDLSNKHPESRNLAHIRERIGASEVLAQSLHQNLQRNSPDWTKAKLQLASLSNQHNLMLVEIHQIQDSIRIAADDGYQNISELLSATGGTVFAYSLVLLLIALMFARNMKAYAEVVIKNRLLAKIPEQNPNPVIGFDHQNQLTYFNRATETIVNSQSHFHLQPIHFFPSNIEALKAKALDDEHGSGSAEIQFGDKYLLFQVHYVNANDTFIAHINDITERKNAEKNLQYQAYHSAHTGIFNLFKLSDDLDKLTRQQSPFALGLLEIRSFNLYLTGHGYDFASELVTRVAQRLVLVTKKLKEDLDIYQIFEHGFAFIVTQNVTQVRLRKLCSIIEKEMEYMLATRWGEVSIELDFGLSIFPEHGKDRSTLMQHARTALGEASEIEHSSFVCYSDELGNKVSERIKLANWLKQAVENEELSLVFQPQLDLSSNRIVGLETLIRWNHAGEQISPGRFIPLAEQFGSIVPIGEWVMRNACEAGVEFLRTIHEPITIAINISPRQFRHPDFVTSVEKILRETGYPPHLLELEITEGVLLYNESDTLSVLRQLKDLGIKLSIDDFGTGYSSLSYLKQFPIDKLKVDQSFVKNLHVNQSDKAIVQVIIELGKSLGLKVIAEGVEDFAHYQYLKSIHCDEIQGYWYSHPLQGDDIVNFLNQKYHSRHLSLEPTIN